MTEDERLDFIHAEIKRLTGTNNFYVAEVDVYPERGIVSVELSIDGRFVRGYAKQCRYKPIKDEWNEQVGLSVATSDALRRAGIPFVTGSARKNGGVLRQNTLPSAKVIWVPDERGTAANFVVIAHQKAH